MNDLNIAVTILKSKLDYYRAKEVIMELGYENIISLKKMKRILNDIQAFQNELLNSKLSNELSLLYFLKKHFSKSSYYSFDYIHRNVINFDISDRQFRRYIQDIKAAGFEIETIRGIDGGYRLKEDYNI